MDLGKVTLGVATSPSAPASSAAFWEITVTQSALPARAIQQRGKAEGLGCACRCIKLFFWCSIKKDQGGKEVILLQSARCVIKIYYR